MYKPNATQLVRQNCFSHCDNPGPGTEAESLVNHRFVRSCSGFRMSAEVKVN